MLTNSRVRKRNSLCGTNVQNYSVKAIQKHKLAGSYAHLRRSAGAELSKQACSLRRQHCRSSAAADAAFSSSL